jgi:hypothetical protein
LADVVGDSELLYRRIPVGDSNLIVREQQCHVSSKAFSDRLMRPSVDRAHLREFVPEKSQSNGSDAVVSLMASQVRAISTVVKRDEKGILQTEFTVDIDPLPILENLAHAEIFLLPTSATPKVFKKLMEALAHLVNQKLDRFEVQGLSCD